MNKIVEIALRNFVGKVNETTGIVHPYDKATCVDLFETLQNGKETFSPEEVVLWLEDRGWTNKHAKSVGIVAQKVLEGKHQKCIRRIYGPEALAEWRKKSIE